MKKSFVYGTKRKASMFKMVFFAGGLCIALLGCSPQKENPKKAEDVYRENVNNLADVVESMDGVACRQNILSIQDVLRMAYQIDGQYPETLQQAAGKDLPVFQCPKTHTPYIYHPTNNGEGYEVLCPNPEAHKLQRLRATEEGLDIFPKLALPGGVP